MASTDAGVRRTAAKESEMHLRCNSLEKWIVFNPDSASPCCHYLDITPPHMAMSDGGLSLDSYQDWLIEIDRLNQEPAGPCHGCRFLVPSEATDVRIVIYTLTFTNTLACNAKCSYCNNWRTDTKTKPLYEYRTIVKQLLERDMVHQDAIFYWSGGEPTIHPEFEELLGFISDKGIRQDVLSSGIRFSPALHAAMTQGNTHLQVSLDAGTPEAYERFKGHKPRVFAKILDNLARYADDPVAAAHINLKYIMANSNSSDADIDGFVKICKDLKVGSVNLSPEIYENKEQRTSEETLRQMIRFARLCNKEQIPLTVMYELFDSSEDAEAVRRGLEESAAGPAPGALRRLGRRLFATKVSG
jgi:sulfatase maturation enzyme AslB (radical SAM superfamily)